MRKTGESYMAARARLTRHPARTSGITRGGEDMYPFEKFSVHAKKALVLAQEEAETAGHGYIGSEHLLLGLMAVADGVAAKVLASLGVQEAALRRRFEDVLGRSQAAAGQQVVPTSRVKKAVELAFEESRRMDNLYVGTEHLLLGLIIEGGSIAALALHELGVTEERVRAEVGRLARSGAIPARAAGGHSETPFLSYQLGDLLQRARQRAVQEDSGAAGLDHLLRALLDEPAFGEVTEVLDRHGVKWNPPEEVKRLLARLHELGLERAEAVRRQQDDVAARLREEQIRLRNELANAERAWLEGRGQDTPPG
jgi:ATP-dependent Clp protease ATP-binding subunit ClpA